MSDGREAQVVAHVLIIVDVRGDEEEEAGRGQSGKLHQLDFSDYFLELPLNLSTTAAFSFVETLVVETKAAAKRIEKSH